MPKVGKKKFPYTAKGMRDAKLYAKGMGKKMTESRSHEMRSNGKKGHR